MSQNPDDQLGEIDDATEAAETSSTTDGPAADGEYDPTQGSPHGTPHPTAESFPDESVGYVVAEEPGTDSTV